MTTSQDKESLGSLILALATLTGELAASASTEAGS